MIECPDCGVMLEYVYAYSRLRQTAFLCDDGSVINYSPVEDVYGIADYRCPNCGKDVSKFITESKDFFYPTKKIAA